MNTKLLFHFLSFVFAVSVNYGCVENTGAISKIFEKYQSRLGPGCAVAVIQNNNVVFKAGYGMASLEHNVPITSASVFDIASVSKQFTGMAIATLIHQGKIAESDDIHKYLPDAPDFGKLITIGNLLHHTSGIRDWPQVLHVAGWRYDEVFSFKDITQMFMHQHDLDFDPGAKYSYSNTGYNLLAMIVEKVSGKSFREWTDENIFSRLGMTHSHFQDDYNKIIHNVAYSYTAAGGGFLKIPGELTAYGSSSLFTSVDDLCKWVIYFQRSVDARDPVFVQMQQLGRLVNGDTVYYGYGLATGQDRGLKTISHTGGWQGYRTIIKNYPDQQFSIIVLSNADDFDPETYASRIADIYLKDKFKITSTAPDRLKTAATIKPDTNILKQYAGMYQLGPGWSVTITLEKSVLMTQANGEDKFPLTAKSDTSFWVDAYGASMTFVSDQHGKVDMLRYKKIDAPRIVPSLTRPEDYPDYFGTYYSDELMTEYRVDTAGGKLMMHHQRLGDFEITADASAKDSFNGEIGNIEFTRDSAGKLTGFLVSGGRLKHLKFTKVPGN